MSRFFLRGVLLSLLLFTFLNADESDECFCLLPIYKATIGPEIYHVKRTREGGTSQTGCLYGFRGSFERIGRYKWYLGIEGLYGKGTIKGHSGSDAKLKSSLSDRQIEGRVGYTFQSKCSYLFSFTPFVGYGYGTETNHYKNPSPLLLKFINESPYISWGFLSSARVMQALTIGFNLKARSLLNMKCKVKNDPMFGDLKMHVQDRVQYRLELPFYYDFYCQCQVFELGLVPFYEWRHYGGRENYPFDFLDTKLKLFGINIQFTYRF